MKTTLKHSLSLLAVSLMMVSCADAIDGSMEGQEGLDKTALKESAPIEGFIKCPIQNDRDLSGYHLKTDQLSVNGVEYSSHEDNETLQKGQFASVKVRHSVLKIRAGFFPQDIDLFMQGEENSATEIFQCLYEGFNMSQEGVQSLLYLSTAAPRFLRALKVKLPKACVPVNSDVIDEVGFMCPEVSDQSETQEGAGADLGLEPLR